MLKRFIRNQKATTMSQLIMIFIITLVGLAVTPSIQEEVTGVTGAGTNALQGEYNLTGAANSIMGLAPLFWVLLVISFALLASYLTLRSAR